LRATSLNRSSNMWSTTFDQLPTIVIDARFISCNRLRTICTLDEVTSGSVTTLVSISEWIGTVRSGGTASGARVNRRDSRLLFSIAAACCQPDHRHAIRPVHVS
jgi:hypothetical protein